MSSVKKNFLYNVIYQILVIILPLITAPYTSRILGAEMIGIYSYNYSIAYYFMIFAMLGISNHGNRMIASTRNNKKEMSKTFWSIYLLQFCSFFISIVIYFIVFFFLIKENRLIALLQVIYILSGMFDISWLFFGLEKFKVTVIKNMIIKILTVVLIFLFVKSPLDLWKYTLIMCLGTFLSQIYLWFNLKKEVYFCFPEKKIIKNNIRQILLLFIPVLSFSIYKVMDKIMLGNMVGYEQVGFYNNSEKIINIPMGIITAFGTVMLPRMTNMIATGERKKTIKYIMLSLEFITILAVPIGFGLAAVSKTFVPIFLGKEFIPSIPMVNLLAITVLFVSWANVIRTQYLIPNHFDNVYITSTIIGAVINLILNILLIPKYQGIGACIGTVVAEFTLMFIQAWAVRKTFSIMKVIKEYLFVFIASIVMYISVLFISKMLSLTIFSLIIQIMLGVIIYIIIVFIILILKKDKILQYINFKNLKIIKNKLKN